MSVASRLQTFAEMPGLLQTPSGQFGEAKFIYALIAEFIGVMLFSFAGSATPTGNVSTQQSTLTDIAQQDSGSANWAPWCVPTSLLVLLLHNTNVEQDAKTFLLACRGNGMSLAVLGNFCIQTVALCSCEHVGFYTAI